MHYLSGKAFQPGNIQLAGFGELAGSGKKELAFMVVNAASG